MLENKDPYQILNISPQASPAEIKRAYRQLALGFHPDINPSPDASERFKEIHAAYQILRNPLRRSILDQARSQRSRQSRNSYSSIVKRMTNDDFQREKSPYVASTSPFFLRVFSRFIKSPIAWFSAILTGIGIAGFLSIPSPSLAQNGWIILTLISFIGYSFTLGAHIEIADQFDKDVRITPQLKTALQQVLISISLICFILALTFGVITFLALMEQAVPTELLFVICVIGFVALRLFGNRANKHQIPSVESLSQR